MDNSDLLVALARDGSAFRDAIASIGSDVRVVSCPGWDVADLVAHLSAVHHFWASVVEQRATSGAEIEQMTRVPDEGLLAAYDATFMRLLDVLDSSDPATAVWTWSAQHDVAFVVRRMAQETAVHRWDAEHSDGDTRAIDAQLAADGIDEFLAHFLDDGVSGAEPVGGSVHIHCADVAGEWTVRPSGAGYDVAREHSKGDCALRGGASNLLLALWRRVPAGAIEIIGDTAVANRFLAATKLD
ncbi:MAG: maleylpyruvate isomerase family mycothiol-dependent enzyme [Ilumatobacteraceae bacterium]